MLLHRKHFILILLIVSLVVMVAIYITHLQSVLDHHFMIDDAFIYLRFVRNATQGFGFVWNRGEAPVEGFTSFFYFMLLVIVEKLGLSLVTFTPVFSIVSSLFILFLSWHLGNSLNTGHKLENLLALLLIGLSPIFLFWSTTGMEMPLYTVFLMISAISYLGYKREKTPAWAVGCLFAITTLTRPESLMLFGITLLFDGLVRWISQKKLFSYDALWMVMGFVVLYLPVFIWKWNYFGYPFPNTYYAKTGSISFVQVFGGLKYLAKSLFEVLPEIGIPLLLILIQINKKVFNTKLNIEQTYIIVLVLCSWGITVLNGGDHFNYGRFLMPTLPLLLVILIALGFSAINEDVIRFSSIKSTLFALAILVVLFHSQLWLFTSQKDIGAPLPPANQSKLEYFGSWHTGFIVMGKTLDTIASKNESIAAVPIGAIGYYSNIKVIDMVGLVDPVIAHEPFDPAYTMTWRPGHDKGDGLYILSKRPDYIQLIDQLTSQPLPGLNSHARQYKSKIEIWASPEFQANYRFLPIQTNGGWFYNLYVRADHFVQQNIQCNFCNINH